VFVGGALDEALAFKGAEAVEDGFVGGDLAAVLDLTEQRTSTVRREVLLDILQDRLLLAGEFGQPRASTGQ